MNLKSAASIATFTALFAGAASADESYDSRWYVSPMATYTYSDAQRAAPGSGSQDPNGAGEGLGFQLGMGKAISKHWNIEGRIQRSEPAFVVGDGNNANGVEDGPGTESGEYDQWGVGVEGQMFFNRNTDLAPYVVLGTSFWHTDVSGVNGNAGDEFSTLMVDAGFGVLSRFTRHGIAVRADVRYRGEFFVPAELANERELSELSLNLGLQIPLGLTKPEHEAVGGATPSFDNRYYVSPMFSYIVADDARAEATEGFGVQVGVGRSVGKYWNLELKSFWDAIDQEGTNASDVEQVGLAVDAMYFLDRHSSFSPYLGASLGAVRSDSNEGTTTNPLADVGLGFLTALTDQGLSLRGDLRYRVDPSDLEGHGVSEFQDYIVSLGLLIPLGPNPVSGPLDSDGDGVIDPNDKCPNTPLGTPVDADGCPLDLDSDGDGVPDSRDKCPNTRKGARVDVNGCEIIAKPAPKAEVIIVYFDFDSAALTQEARRKLDGVAGKMKTNPVIIAIATGHADALGSVEYNQDLSERRARAVRSYLVAKGIDGNQISTSGRSELEPAATNATKNGRSLNRRVEIRLLHQGK